MQAAPDTVVTLSWHLTDAQNEPIADDEEGTDFYVGGADLLPVITQDLLGKGPGESGQLQIEPHDAFGDYDPELLRVEDRRLFLDVLEPGLQFEQLPAGCAPAPPGTLFTVTDLADNKVILDGNHPLAGQTVRFIVNIVDIRDATAEEIANGRPEDASAPRLH